MFYPFELYTIKRLHYIIGNLIKDKLNNEKGQLISGEHLQDKGAKENKNLMLNGKNLNLSERFKIANKVLDIDNKLRKLNIKELEKYDLLAKILNCHKDNARDLMNGKYNSKDRDLTDYFDQLGLIE
jgi:uncharacterized protein YfeS